MLFDDAGLREVDVATPDQMISTRAYRRVLNAAADMTSVRHFGLALSQRQTYEKFGAVGYLVRHAPSLSVALERLMRYIRVHDAGSLVSVDIEDGIALLTHSLAGLGDEASIQQSELAIGLTCRFIRSALGDRWSPETVYFEHAAPADLRPFSSVFRCPIHYEQTTTGIEILARDLASPMKLSDPGLYEVLEAHVEAIDREVATDFVAHLRQKLRQNLEHGPIRIDQAAEMLDIRRHTLQRKLKLKGTNFQNVLDDVRYDLGRRYLQETTTPISEIAVALGYAETAVFTRAFSRRSGLSPNAWRRDHVGPDAKRAAGPKADQASGSCSFFQ